ncbi:MAG: hypothetical protein ISR78_04320 [Spirochaetia bacterium]|nr:hypothetical protein [Spirochaetia bacterium]
MKKLHILLFSFILFASNSGLLSADEYQTIPRYKYIVPLNTHQLDEYGLPLKTTASVICKVDMYNAQKALLIDSYYNHWVIPGLNAMDTDLHTPMSVFDRIETSNTGEELYLYFDLRYPFQVDDIMIPFVFTICSNDEKGTRVELRLKKRNIAVRNASLDLLVQKCESGTILSAELTIDFSFVIDVLLNKPLYSENTENRLRLCMEKFLLLIAEQNLTSTL